MSPTDPNAPSSLSRLSSLELCSRRPKLEQSAPVLWHVLKACVFLDEALKAELADLPLAPACGPGCDACCYQAIPLSVAEVAAIRAFLRLAAMPPPEAERPGDPNRCPFLGHGHCTIYPVRPFACRRFIVFNQRCTMGEDPTVARPADVFHPSRKVLFETLCLTLPVYQALGLAVPATVTREFFTGHTSLAQTFPWRKLKEFEPERAEAPHSSAVSGKESIKTPC